MLRIFLILSWGILVPHLLFTQTNGLNDLDVARIQSVTSAQISSDGNHVLFTRSVPADPLKENKPATNTLHLYQAEAEISVPFMTRQSVRSVTFRPAHESITFLARMPEDELTSLYEMPLSGGEAIRIFSFETSISAYEWSSDGSELAFIAAEPQESKKSSELPYEPILYESDLTYYRAYLMKGLDQEPEMVPLEGHVRSLKWSPVGDRLAVSTSPTPLVDDFYMAQTIFIVNAKTLETVGKVDHAGKKGDYAWSPDGARIAMIAADNINDPIDGRLQVVDGRGGKPQILVPDFPGEFNDFAWLNAKTLVFLASEGVESTIGTINYDASGMKRILTGTEVNFSSFDLGKDGRMALVGSSPQHPSEAFLWDLNAEDRPERITGSNPWLEEKDLGPQEVVRYEARDGLELEGLLIYPLNYEEGEKYPLITVVHGGPESHYDNGWITGYSSPGQMAAAQGYMVFYPNYRGSTGRGVEFAMSSQGDLAGKEFDDIVDGVDYLIEKGLVDEDKVGVTGGSYGGYATGWMATRYTDRFAAGVMFVGISDNLSKWGTSDIPEELYLVHARKRVWEDYDWFLERSPVYYAGQAKTPLLIMAGAEDTRVDPSQSMELYRHIKTRTDTPVSLVLYPGEGHGNRNATARLDYSRRMLGWFNQYLKEAPARP